ncbi:MAG: hypothetical protein H9W81_09830 [Enterococcus sp.]|nr:hypothetical protein [Enterococcus sp.]
MDETYAALVKNEILLEMAEELPADRTEWDTSLFHIHAAEEAYSRGLDESISSLMIAKALREIAS